MIMEKQVTISIGSEILTCSRRAYYIFSGPPCGIIFSEMNMNTKGLMDIPLAIYYSLCYLTNYSYSYCCFDVRISAIIVE